MSAWRLIRDHPSLDRRDAASGIASGMNQQFTSPIDSGRLRHSGLLQPLEEFAQGFLKRRILVWNFLRIDLLYTRQIVTRHLFVEIIQRGDSFSLFSGKRKGGHQMRSAYQTESLSSTDFRSQTIASL